MDYVRDDCMNLFTEDQSNRTRALFASGGIREQQLNNWFKVRQSKTPIRCTGVVYSSPACLSTTWSVLSGPATLTPGPGPNQATLTATGTGIVTIRAISGNYTTDDIIEVSNLLPGISAGYPLMVYSQPGDENEVCRYEGTVFDLTYTEEPTSIIWNAISWQGGPSPSWSQTASNGVYVEFFKSTQNTLLLQMNATNNCGTSSYNFGFKAIDCENLRVSSLKLFRISPNPATSSITINPTGNDNKLITYVIVSDYNSNILIQKKIDNEKSLQLYLGSLKTGIYNVRIICGTYSETEIIQKK